MTDRMTNLPVIQKLHFLYWYRFMHYAPIDFLNKGIGSVLPRRIQVQIDYYLWGLQRSEMLNENFKVIS